jgi:Na+/H+ antiporter NhaA
VNAEALTGRTAWRRNLETPLREFLRTETGSAALILAAVVAALVWANVDLSSYDRVWSTRLSIQLGGASLSQSLLLWIDNGLMTFFFFVVGLEARREYDLGELRERSRAALPVLAGVGGAVAAVLIYLAFNAGHSTASGWGTAMSTETAFALGMLALVGPRFPDRLRAFMLTVVVVDDIVGLIVIATVYTSTIHVRALTVAGVLFAVVLFVRARRVRAGFVYAVLGLAMWVALLKSGIDPLVVGLAFGLLTFARPAARSDLERASDLFRRFREQPTPELAKTARTGLAKSLSPNARLQELYHPWTSYLIVPLFALANAGIHLDGALLSRAAASRVTLGIFFGYVVGKPLGIFGLSWLLARVTHGRLRPPVGWAAVAGAGTIAGIGFTVALLIAALAFDGQTLEEAKVGILAAALAASLITWLVFRATQLLPRGLRLLWLLGTSEPLTDLAVDVDPEHDHVRGPLDAPVTVVEYGDFECPYCGRAEPAIRELLAEHGDVRYVWRHLPLNDVHPHTQQAAEASEAAAYQGAFWPMHDVLLDRQDALELPDLIGYARELGLDTERFEEDLREERGAARVAEDVDSADLSGVSGTPTFFINGRRHHGAYDLATLAAAVKAAGARAELNVLR